MGTGRLISIVFFAVVYELAAMNDTVICDDFVGFMVLKSPEICFCHLSGNPAS